MGSLLLQMVVFSIVDLLRKQWDLIKSQYVVYSWERYLNCVNYSDFGASRRLHSSILRKGRLDIYILWLTNPLWDVGELFPGFRWRVYHNMVIHNHCVLSWVIISVFYRFFYYSKHTCQTFEVNIHVKGQ